MRRIVIVILVCLTFAITGCDAFKDHYDSPGDINALLGLTPEVPGSDDTVLDISGDATACEHNMNIVVTVIDQGAVATDAGWTTENGEYEVKAEQLAEVTTKLTISNDAGQLSFTLKRVGGDTFDVCNVSFSGCNGECVGSASLWTEVLTGTIEIVKFNEENVNTGNYTLSFGESSTADAGLDVTGSYMTDVLTPAAE